MTRTKEMASSRPQETSIAGIAGRRSRQGMLLVALLALITMASGVAHADEATTGYTQTPPPPTTTTVTTTVTTPPVIKTVPSKVTPRKKTEGSKEVIIGPPVTVRESAPPRALPFTGLDLRLIVAAGVLLLGVGLSIRVMQRRSQSS